MKDELTKELQQRGTAEISNGVVNQVTQALNETESEVKFLIFGELQTKGIITIGEACAKCDHCHFKTVKECQEFQAKDSRARGFTTLVCPQQFIE